ncbi:Uncharacterised protein [Bordetella pertussis]|nr:Uncharacterised protein [Bordetella pertussis]
MPASEAMSLSGWYQALMPSSWRARMTQASRKAYDSWKLMPATSACGTLSE